MPGYCAALVTRFEVGFSPRSQEDGLRFNMKSSQKEAQFFLFKDTVSNFAHIARRRKHNYTAVYIKGGQIGVECLLFQTRRDQLLQV